VTLSWRHYGQTKAGAHELENAGELIGLEYAMEFRSAASTGSENIVAQAVALFQKE